MRSPIRAILFDLDGVLRHFDRGREADIEARYSLPSGTLRTALFEPTQLHRAVTGLISDEVWRAEAAASLGKTIGPQAPKALEELGQDRGQIDLAILALIHRLRRSFPVGLLTNATSRLSADLQLHKLVDAFDVIVNSYDVGCCKPDLRVFEVAARKMGHPLAELLFIDDTPGHVQAARNAGMISILFTGAEQLQTDLAAAGIA